MKKLTASQIEKLNSIKNSVEEELINAQSALTHLYAMAKVVKDTGETYECKELQEIGEKIDELTTHAHLYILDADLKTEWERVRELVRFKWSEE